MGFKFKKQISPIKLIEKIIKQAQDGVTFRLADYDYNATELQYLLNQLKTSTIEDKILYCKYTLARRINSSNGIKYNTIIKSNKDFDVFSWYLSIVLLDIKLEELVKFINNEKITKDDISNTIKYVIKPQREKIFEAALKYDETKQQNIDKTTHMLIELFIMSDTPKEYDDILSRLEYDLGNNTILSRKIENIIFKNNISKEKLEEVRNAQKRQIENEEDQKPENIISFFSQKTDDELEEFLKTEDSDKKVNKLKKLKHSNPSLKEKIIKQINRIDPLIKKISIEQKEQIRKEKKVKLIKYYETMYKDGLWNKSEFIRQHYKEYGFSSTNEMQEFISYVESICFNKEEKEYYKNAFERNRIEEYKKIKPLINKIVSGQIKDIIDYYLETKMPISKLIQLIRGLMTAEEKTILSQFIGQYYNTQNITPKYPEYKKGTIEQYRNIENTSEKEELTLYFLKKYNIPDNFFVFALVKLESIPELKQKIINEIIIKKYIMGEYRTLKQAAEQNNISIDKIKNYIRKIKNSNKQDEIELYKEYLEIATENQQQAKIKGGQNGKRTTTYSIEQINSWYSMIVEGDMTLDEVEKETGISKSVIHENLNNNLSDLQRKQLEIIYEKHKRNATKNYQNDLEFFLENGTNVVGFTKKSRR